MYSLERRRERYMIMYVFKIIHGVVPNLTGERYKIKTRISERRGLECTVPSIAVYATAKFKSLVDKSFAVCGPRLFNCVPKDVRNSNLSCESFKNKLDRYLASVPDKPSLPNYYQSAVSNCLLDQIEQMRRDGTNIA